MVLCTTYILPTHSHNLGATMSFWGRFLHEGMLSFFAHILYKSWVQGSSVQCLMLNFKNEPFPPREAYHVEGEVMQKSWQEHDDIEETTESGVVAIMSPWQLWPPALQTHDLHKYEVQTRMAWVPIDGFRLWQFLGRNAQAWTSYSHLPTS